uniref:WAP domain-containing protein n=1 Tax=Naja naja TaxID=35670 RepID=A0A8C6VA57_NAJNA
TEVACVLKYPSSFLLRVSIASLSDLKKPKSCPEEIRKCPTKGQYECNNDSECKKNKKCCFSNCALRCVEPH